MGVWGGRGEGLGAFTRYWDTGCLHASLQYICNTAYTAKNCSTCHKSLSPMVQYIDYALST